jgi:hypothetical protein
VDSTEPAERDGLDREHRGKGALATDAVGYAAPKEAPDGIENTHYPEQGRNLRGRQAVIR